jgi:hypothetical protein
MMCVVLQAAAADRHKLWTFNLSHREAASFKVPLRHHNHAIIGIFPVRADGDFDPLTEGGQKPEEAVDGVACNAATYERRHLRLVEPEQFGGLGLRELPLGDQVPNALDEFSLGQGQFGVRNAKISEHVPASPVDVSGFISG